MSWQACKAAWQSDLPPLHKYVLLALADYADAKGGNVWPSVSTLVQKTGLSESTVHRALKALLDSGRIAEQKGISGRLTNTYRVVSQRRHTDTPPDSDRHPPEILTDTRSVHLDPTSDPTSAEREKLDQAAHVREADEAPALSPADRWNEVFVGDAKPTTDRLRAKIPARTPREAAFRAFRQRFEELNGGTFGNATEAGLAWNQHVPPGAEPETMQQLEAWGASPELVQHRADGLRPIHAATWLGQRGDWSPSRVPTIRRAHAAAKPDPNAGLREYQAAREAGLSPWDIIAGKRAPEGVIEGELVAR